MMGHDCRIAYDAAEAIECAPAFQPELVLIDLGMPRVDGCMLARQLRQLPEAQAAILAAYTGFTDAAHRQRAREAGFDHYLIKPVEWQMLEELIMLVQGRPQTV